ncbi:phage major capsid protein [Elstera cyanobacteriorum]|uniref:phage major capsid protein n=1 Tax=Elstera cyanobacteriorum TaxID=2022747 RepID=UPI0023537D37|nr:phage major capsid protein [Elstera cyanobacteriorum]MCK6444408.1 phage major capsid protein [Elstera cyanobacteriorum]
MAENPSLIPADLIAEAGADLTARLTAAARQAVEAALAADGVATLEDILQALESLVDSLPAALVAGIEDALPLIAEQAIERAQVEIADVREESGEGFPPVPSEPAGDYSGWAASAAAALVAAARAAAEAAPTVEAARAAAVDAVAPPAFSVMAETASARTVNQSRLNTFKANSDVVKKLKVVTVHDQKRSEVCTYMSDAEFSIKAKNIPTPPFHNSCRSYLIPITNIKRKPGATEAEITRQNWAVYRRLEREAKEAAAEGRGGEERLEFRFAPDLDAAGTFSGYAVTWNQMDSHKTMFSPGSLVLPSSIPLLWSHDPTRPVGVVTETREDQAGLFIVGKVTTETRDGAESYAFLKQKAVTGLSIGFKRLADEAAPGGRRITRAEVKEISLVTIPSNSAARVIEVRCASPDEPAAGAAKPHEEMKMSETTAPAGAEEVRSAVDALARRLDRIEARGSRLPLGGESAADDGLERRAFNSFVKHGREAMAAEEVRALRASDSAAGGVTVPPGFASELLKKLVENSPIRALATVTTISGGDLILPKQTAAPTAAWVAETGTRPATEPAFAQVKIDAHEAGCYVDVSQRLLEDNAVNLEGELSTMLAAEFARLEGLAFLKGDGTGKPKGIIGHADFQTLANGHAANLSADALIRLMYSLPATYRNQGVWLANGTTIGKLRTLKDGSGNYLWRPSLAEGSPESLLGRPIVEAVDMDDIAADEIPLIFGDIKTAYRVADRVGVSLLRDPYSVATTGLVRFHSRIRVGGDLVMGAAVKGLLMAV